MSDPRREGWVSEDDGWVREVPSRNVVASHDIAYEEEDLVIPLGG